MSYSLQTPSIKALTRAAGEFHSGGMATPELTQMASRNKQRRNLLKRGYSSEEAAIMLRKMGYAEPVQRRAK